MGRMKPGNGPFNLLDRFAKSTGRLYDNKGLVSCKMLIADQLLNLVDSVYRRDVNERGYEFQKAAGLDDRWKCAGSA
jgi:hypothetical protein